MKYQLVIQWPAFTMNDYDVMVEIENTLIEKLSETNEVDGHDAGANEVNIFIRTNNPEIAFDEIRTILGSSIYWDEAKIAYRELSKNGYIILWPKDLDQFKIA